MRALAAVPMTPGITTKCCKACEHTQNTFDLCSCLLLVVTFAVKLINIHLSGTLGYWLCIILISESLLWASVNGAQISLMSATIERYLKMVHHKATWSKKLLHKWINSGH